MIARSIFIAGQVQGVFFREWTLGKAREYGVAGYVRNTRDGGVEVFVQGEPLAVERFMDRLRTGPPTAVVEDMTIGEAATQQVEGFSRRQTL